MLVVLFSLIYLAIFSQSVGCRPVLASDGLSAMTQWWRAVGRLGRDKISTELILKISTSLDQV